MSDSIKADQPRFARVPLAAAAAANLHARELRVLIAICTSADRNGRAWPGVTEIGRRTQIDRGKIPELIKRLEAAGLILVERRPGGGNTYTINFGAELPPPTGTVDAAEDNADVSLVSPPRGTVSVPAQGDSECPRAGVSPPTGTKQIEQIYEEAKASSGAEAPQVNGDSAERGDLKTMVFGFGRRWLAAATGKSDPAARRLLGKWCSEHGDGKVIEVLIAARDANPADPVPWIVAALKARGSTRGRFDPPAFRRGDIL